MKGTISIEALVIVIFTIIVIAIMLIPMGKYFGLFEDISEKSGCEWSVFLHGSTKLLGVEQFPVKCRANQVTLDKKSLVIDTVTAKKGIKEFQTLATKNEKILTYFDEDNEKIRLEYAVDKRMAEELRSCWDKVLWGEFPLFNEWWNLVDMKSLTGETPRSAEDVNYENFIARFHMPPTTCIICSRIKYADEIKAELGTEKIQSLDEWMRFTPVTDDPKKRSYYEYTLDDVRKGLFSKAMTYSVDEPQAVIYGRINVHYLRQGATLAEYFIKNQVSKFSSIWGIEVWNEVEIPERGVNVLAIVPYKDLKGVCTYAIG